MLNLSRNFPIHVHIEVFFQSRILYVQNVSYFEFTWQINVFQFTRSYNKLQTSVYRMRSDGLNSLNYTVEQLTEHPLYTLIKVDVKDALAEYYRLYGIEDHNT